MTQSSLNLKSMSYDGLFQMVENAVGLIVRHKQVGAAEEKIAEIQSECKRPYREGDTFAADLERSDTAMLRALRYHVVHTRGRTPSARKEILKYVLLEELPMAHSASYSEE